MQKNQPARRDFIKLSAIGLAGLSVSPSVNNKADKKLNILCLGAHPGDPEFGCGGTMARYSGAGHHVTFLYLTRGEASDPAKTYTQMAALRTKEAETSSEILGATSKFAGQIDGNSVLSKDETARVGKLIIAENPDIVFTQWPVDGHPDHQVTGMIALTTWVKAGRQYHLYFYEVNTGVETMGFVPTDYVDITACREKKKQAMFSHQTQDPVNTYNDYFKPLEEFRGLEAGVKAAEAFIHFKPKDAQARIVGL